MEGQAAPHQGVVIYEKNGTRHGNSLSRMERLVKDIL
jgi:hypothetical protein